MWSPLIFLVVAVGLCTGSDYGWKPNTEYSYNITGRTLTSISDVADQYTGIILKAKFTVRPESEGKLMAKITDSNYAKIHTTIHDGWQGEISDEHLKYEPLPLTDKPFEIIIESGVIADLIVPNDIENWEGNMLKSIVSQIQIDTTGKNVIKSHITQLPEEDSKSAVFKTVEETITGKFETLYDISILPEYVIRSQPWLVPKPDLREDGEFMEIVKTKNFSSGYEHIGYHYGLENNIEWETSTNKMGDFFLRSSVSRCIVSGKLTRYTIQSCTTTNKIIVSPTLNNKDKGVVVSHMNATLIETKETSGDPWKVEETAHLGGLVYSYSIDDCIKITKSQSLRESESNQYQEERRLRHPRNITAGSASSEEDFKDLHEAPSTPFLAMLVGYKGKHIKGSEKVDIVDVIKKMCEQIGNNVLNPDVMLEESTLSRYTILVRIIRAVTDVDIKKAADYLYTESKDGIKVASWEVFRDAVAEAGTGPSLLTIKEWIMSKRVRSEEAAELVAILAQAVRIPSNNFIRTFYSLVTAVQSEDIVNDTAILAFASLVRKIYITKEFPHNHFPIKSFDSMSDEKDREEFVVNEFIPYLKEKLEQAVESSDSHKILVYIRALGNVAHKRILAVFEPYLEGQKHISCFQRLQIVLALDKLIRIHPKVCQSVMYKIYLNSGESAEMRVAAVYQLMRTHPTSSMLQRMAQYTNVDMHEHVNAAVKSSIQSAASLEGDEYSELAENARSAEPLLTKRIYGYQYSYNHLVSYVIHHMNLFYKQNLQMFGSLDSFIPKGINYHLKTKLGGFKDNVINIQAMVSSIAELANVLYRQTEEYHTSKKQQQEHYEEALQNKYSSESIFKLLNFEVEESEYLEGNFLLKLGGGVTRFFTFNNRSIAGLPHVIHEVEELLRQGKTFNFTKFINRQDIAISFPTEMSVPFVYMLDAPTVISINGEMRLKSDPAISDGSMIRKPNTVEGRAEIQTLFSTKVEAEVGFVTPFDHQEYKSGYHKNIHVYLPLAFDIKYDSNMTYSSEFQIQKREKTQRIFHYSTVPYTCNKDLINFEPCSKIGRTIEGDKKIKFQTVIGNTVGIPLRVSYISENNIMETKWFYNEVKHNNMISSLFAPYYDESIEYTKFDVDYAGDIATTKKIKVKLIFNRTLEYDKGVKTDFNIHAVYEDFKNCHRRVTEAAASGIRMADVRSVHATVELMGNIKTEYMVCAAFGHGQLDRKSRALMLFKKEPEHYEAAVEIKSHFPYADGIDLNDVMKLDPTSKVMATILLGKTLQSGTKFTAEANLTRSQSRLNYLERSPRAQQCRREMQEGNKHLSACANITEEVNILDRIKIKLDAENMTATMRNTTFKLFRLVRYLTFFNFEENYIKASTKTNKEEATIFVQFEPTFDYVNVTIDTRKSRSVITNLRVNEWLKPIVAVHPVFPVEKRIMSELLNIDTFTPTCVVDNSSVTTFANVTYPLDLEHSWAIMFKFMPTKKYPDGRVEDQNEQYVILVRDTLNNKNEKEVKLTLRAPHTSGILVELDMSPSDYNPDGFSGLKPSAKVLINQKQYYFDNTTAANLGNLSDFLKVYTLPNGEVKIEIHNGFVVTYEGGRIEISNVEQKFRNCVEGLCGKFNGLKYDAFMTPRKCILADPFEFASTYAIEETDSVRARKANALKSKCHYDKIVYSNVVSDRDAGRSDGSSVINKLESCAMNQTRYIEDGKDVCFTIRPIPVCKGTCNNVKKNVEVHCVLITNVAQLWMKQIESGGSPDFSTKRTTKILEMSVPESC